MIKVSELVQKKYSLEAEYKNKMKVVNKALEAAAKELAKEKEKSISKTIYDGYGTVLFGNKKELDKIGIELEKKYFKFYTNKLHQMEIMNLVPKFKIQH